MKQDVVLASPQSSASRKVERARQSAMERLGMKEVHVDEAFTGGFFVCSICQNSFVLDEIDVEHVRRLNPEAPRAGSFFPVCHTCIGITGSFGFQVWTNMCGSRGLTYRLKMWVLSHLFGVAFSGERRTTTVIRPKPHVEQAIPDETTTSGEAKT